MCTPWSGFSCLKRCHPRVFVWDLWSCLGQQSEYKNYSHSVTTTTDGSASSPSSICATRTLGLASRKPVKHPFSFPCIQLRARSRASVSYEYMWTFCPYSATSTACKIMIVSTSSGVPTLVGYHMKSRVCNDISVGHGHQVLRLTLSGELLSQEKSERIFCIITRNECVFVSDANSIF